MEHTMEELPRTMKSNIHSTQRDRPRRAEDQESKPGAFGLRVESVGFLQVLEGVDAEEELGDGEEEHESEEEGDVPCWCLAGA